MARPELSDDDRGLVEPLLPIGGYAPYPHRLRDLKAWRVIATRYDKTPESYLAALHLRGAIIWLRGLRPPAPVTGAGR